MFDAETARLLGAGLMVGTLAGVFVLLRIVAQGRKAPGRVVAKRDQVRGAEQIWATVTIVVQFWSAGVILLPAYFYAWPAPPSFPLERELQVVGVIMWASGMVLVDLAAWVLGRFLGSSAQVRADHHLVQEGPYRWIRHPMYAANVAMALGLALAYLSVPLLLLGIVLMATAVYRARLEDGLLPSPQAFGPRYVAYMARTGRFLPRLRMG